MNSSALTAPVQPYIDRNEIAGAVVFVADKDGMLATGAAGWADVEARRPMTPESLFWAASQTKPITAIAVMMLVEEGKLSVKDPVEKYLPEFAGQMYIAKKDENEILLRKPSRPTTVEDLIIHSSGMAFVTPNEKPTLDLLTLETAVRGYAMYMLDFEPGTDSRYSNAGFNTAGRIVEVVSGQLYEDFLDERLFRPLGMRDTTFRPTEEQVSRLAETYRRDKEGRLNKIRIDQLHYPLTDAKKRFPFPAGGLFSTAHDIAALYRMMVNEGALDGRVYLKPETIREMTRRHTPENWERSQGYGFIADGKNYGHGGAFGTHTQVDRASGLILGWMVQHAASDGEDGKARLDFEKAALAQFAGAKS